MPEGVPDSTPERIVRSFLVLPSLPQRPARSRPTAAELMKRGAAHLAAGELEAALAAFEEGARRHPAEWRFPCNAGTVLHRLGRTSDALQRVKAALVLAPTESLPHRKLGTWLLELDEPAAALKLLERAVALSGDGLEELLHLATAYLETQRLGHARGVIARLLERYPESAEAHVLHGLALTATGERAESTAALRRALALDPACPQAVYHLARRGEALDPAPLRARFEDPSLPKALRSKLGFALGNLYERRGEHAEAFAYFARANALVDARWDPQRHRAAIDAVIAEESRASITLPGGAAPIFIVGLPRSGSTLLEEILAAHPSLQAVGEHSQGFPRLARELPGLRAGVRPFPQGLADLEERDLQELARRYLASLPVTADSTRRTVDKLLANFQYLGLIARLFPDARILNCRRDPRDSGLSTYFLEFQRNELPWAYDLEHIASTYRDYERLMAHWRAHSPLPILDVPYEELVAEPEAWTRRVLAFLGLPWDERCLCTEPSRRSVFTASALQVREAPHTLAVARWKPYAAFLGPLARLAAT